MHRIKTTVLLLGAAIVQATVGCALAADMAIPSSAPVAPNPGPVFYTPPAFSWSGFYIGGNFGWDWSQISDTITIAGAGTGTLSGNVKGFLGGGQFGYNWQVCPWLVAGVETDFQGGQATAGSRSVNAEIGPAKLLGIATTPYFGTVRGRVGYAYGFLLFYATGGALYGDNVLKGTLSGVNSFASSATFWSLTAGAGVEASLGGHFSAKLEYLFAGSPSTMPPIPQTTATNGTIGTNIVRAGINYRF